MIPALVAETVNMRRKALTEPICEDIEAHRWRRHSNTALGDTYFWVVCSICGRTPGEVLDALAFPPVVTETVNQLRAHAAKASA